LCKKIPSSREFGYKKVEQGEAAAWECALILKSKTYNFRLSAPNGWITRSSRRCRS
jgi:hypothetical protein